MRPSDSGRARGLVSSRASGTRIEARTFPPRAALAPWVAQLWITRWDLQDQVPHVAELLADPCINLAFESSDNGTSARLVGLSTHLFRRELRGVGHIRAVKLRAGAARAVLGPRRISELTDRIVPLHEALAEGAALAEAVLAPDDDEAGLAVLEAWLSQRVATFACSEAKLAAQVVDAAADPELTTVTGLARRTGLAPRQLQRLFRDFVGASPKWLLRRLRLQEAAVRLERPSPPAIAELAAELGYADHAHFTRDFKAATGRTPASFVRQT